MAMYLAYYGNHSSLPDDAEYVSMANWTTYTYSRGHVHITGSGLTDPVDFDTGWLKDPGDVDVKKHIWAAARDVAAHDHLLGRVASYTPRFSPDSKAAIIERTDGPI
ncbi:hypothetical protein LTR37_020842 [Vermiconidia calcicola]|uniref:Uncharacterized protein n=1 Tax=Vermiconidia calcicola TaxID=1690605 RepID=A0ACC3MAA2_9PEZI|nr:hypothetical protein LTR37_020842 [Vermiconidia calcicola]